MAKKKKKTGQLSDAFSKNKGKLHRALGYSENETIPQSVLESAAKQKGSIGKMARPAVNMAKARRKTKRGK